MVVEIAKWQTAAALNDEGSRKDAEERRRSPLEDGSLRDFASLRALGNGDARHEEMHDVCSHQLTALGTDALAKSG